MTERLAEAVARRGGPPLNVLSWEWNAATLVSVNRRVNAEATVAQGVRLAASLDALGVRPEQAHLIGQSSGAIVATSAARAMLGRSGRPAAQLTLLDPATPYHDLVFDRLAAGTAAVRVENYWAPGLSGFGRPVAHAGVTNVRVDGRGDAPAAFRGPRSAHLDVVRWYLGTVTDTDTRSPRGFAGSVFGRRAW
jgi:hypothetical protein